MCVFDLNVCGLEDDLSAFWHGVARIDCQIHQNLFNLMGVSLDCPQIVAEQTLQLNISTNHPTQQGLDASYSFIQIHEHWLEDLLTAERQKTMSKAFGRYARTLNFRD